MEEFKGPSDQVKEPTIMPIEGVLVENDLLTAKSEQKWNSGELLIEFFLQ